MIKKRIGLPIYSILFPVLATLSFFFLDVNMGSWAEIVKAVLLIGSVLAAVHHAEVVAHKVGEPYGTIILALAITIIEVGLIVSLMLAGGPGTIALARDTIFAAIMIILNGILGICILVGGIKYREQIFGKKSANTALITLLAIIVLTLILPNYTTSIPGPMYNKAQLIFVGIISLILYGSFIMIQTVRHRDYFLLDNEEYHAPPKNSTAIASLLLLVGCLCIVVLLAKKLSPTIEHLVAEAGAPKSLVGVIIAAVVLMPEALAAYKAASNNRLQTSLNLALGSALASIGLTIPAIAVVSIVYDIPLVLGLDIKSTILLALSFFIVRLSLNQGKTNVLYGIVLLTVLASYIFTVIVP